MFTLTIYTTSPVARCIMQKEKKSADHYFHNSRRWMETTLESEALLSKALRARLLIKAGLWGTTVAID